MSKCLHPECLAVNEKTDLNCQKCGSNLLLRERYRGLKILGKGEFAETFLGVDEDKPSQPFCVIKQFSPQAQGTNNLVKASEFFVNEGAKLEQLGKHPQIPDLFACFTKRDRQYVVQEFIKGNNLQEVLDAKGIFKEHQIKQLLLAITPILKAIHQQELIHRDIKPENFILNKRDKTIFLVDFGLSRILKKMPLLGTVGVIHSHQYKAPEQLIGKTQYTSDLYSLGVTCLHLLTGIEPFHLFDMKNNVWIWGDYLKTNPISEQLAKILDRLTIPAYEKRYQLADEVLADLNSSTVQTKNYVQVKSSTNQIYGSYLSHFTFEVITVDERGKVIQRYWGQAQQFVEDLGKGTLLEMVAIPSGSFLMGASETEAESRNNERPQYRVEVAPFFISKYPITQAQYQLIMGNNPSSFEGINNPVERVNWRNALTFCQRLSEKTSKTYRLPNEGEWEYACRGRTTTPFYFGETLTSDLANYKGNYSYKKEKKGKYLMMTTPVGSFPPNAFGLYDLHGNVWEWCTDVWHRNDSIAPNKTRTTSSSKDNLFLLRGGSWSNTPAFCRCASRLMDLKYPERPFNNIGFRPVCTAIKVE